MLKMRLQRVGVRKHETTFRLVLTDSKNSTKSGRFKEILGSFDPRKTTEAFKTERINHWLGMGISVTPTVHNLFVTHGLIKGTKKNVLPRKTPIIKEVKETPVAEVAPVTEAAPIAEAPIVETPVETPASPETEA
jgi:small subunit ribosomal protein S16